MPAELPPVSVALATYNGAKHLREQLDSLAAQTELPVELVVSDDKSIDETITIVKEFGRTAPFDVRILPEHERLGFSDNFLHAAENCQSSLIMFCDQDDRWIPNKLEVSRRRLCDDRSSILLHTLTMTDDTMQPFNHLSQGIERTAVYEPLEFEPFLCGYGNTMMFRRELLHLVPRASRPPADGRTLSHDTWVYTLAAALGRVTHLKESFILYRQHGNNISHLDKRSRLQRLIDLATFNAERHLDIVRFNGCMADIFDRIAAEQSDWSNAAKRAAACYRDRQAAVQLRLELFAGPTVSRRLKSFLTLERERWAQPDSFAKKAPPTAKNFVLGVLAMGKRIPAAKVRS